MSVVAFPHRARDLPLGTVTFLFTDIEGSTGLARTLGDRWPEVLADHQRLLHQAFAGGYVVDTEGDAFFVAFARARDAVVAAVEAQRALASHAWPSNGRVAVRIGVHTGEAQVVEGKYRGVAVHRAARIGAAAHGGQILLSESTQRVLEDEPVQGVSLRDLGRYKLKDIERAEHLFQVAAEGLPLDFPPPRADRSARPWWLRRRVHVAVAAIALAAAAVAGVASRSGSRSAGAVRLVANSVAIIDGKTGTATGDVPLTFTPDAVATDGTSVWVTNTPTHTAARIDAATGRVVQTAGFRGATAGGSVSQWVGGGRDWIAVQGAVATIGPGAAVATQIALWRPSGGLSGFCPAVVTGGGGAVWVSQGRHLAELDRFGNVRHRWALPAAPAGGQFGTCYQIAYGAGDLFADRWPDGSVGRIVTTSGTYTPLVQIPGGNGSFRDLAVGFSSIWIAAVETQVQAGSLQPAVHGTVTQYAAVSGQETAKTAIGQAADAIALDPASGVWVLDKPEKTIGRIDPTTGKVTQEISLRHFACCIAAANGKVVVSVQLP